MQRAVRDRAVRSAAVAGSSSVWAPFAPATFAAVTATSAGEPASPAGGGGGASNASPGAVAVTVWANGTSCCIEVASVTAGLEQDTLPHALRSTRIPSAFAFARIALSDAWGSAPGT